MILLAFALPAGFDFSCATFQVSRVAEVSSGHPAMQKINPHVVAMWIVYPYPQSPPIVLQSKALLIRAAAERLSARGRCLPQ